MPTRRIPCSLLVLLSALPLAGQERARHGVVFYDPPPGCEVAKKDGSVVFTTKDGSTTITMLPVVPLGKGLERLADARVLEDQKRDQYREEAKRSRGKHARSGGWWVGLLCSYADPQRPGQFLCQWTAFVAAGDRVVEVRLLTTSAATYNQHNKLAAKLIDDLEFTTTLVVEKGRPPLTRFMLDETVDFLEWLLETPLSDEQRGKVVDEVRGYWRDEDDKEMEGIQELLTARKQLAAMQPAERDVARAAVQQEAVGAWRKDPDDAAAKMLLAIYDAAHQPIAAGEPPLTRQAAEAWAEFLYFAAGQTAGCSQPLPKETRDKLVAETAKAYPQCEAEQRQLIAGMPLVWGAVRVLWPDLSAEQKQACIAGWKQNPQLAELGKQVAASAAAAAQRNLASMQARLQMQNAQFQMMSNIMRMQHETSMIIIGNMGGNTRYEYRWR